MGDVKTEPKAESLQSKLKNQRFTGQCTKFGRTAKLKIIANH